MSNPHVERTLDMKPSTDPIDDAYNSFETAWRNGARPRIEDYLEAASEGQRRDFLEALFYLELDYRQRFDELPTAQEYLVRFPKESALVKQVFDDALISLGEYQVIEKVGEGGMGQVFKARHSTMNRVVALKVLPKSQTSDAQAVARFRQEVEIVARLSDPHVVQAYDAGSSRGTHFLVMEFVDGLDLAKLVRQNGPLPVPLACEVIRQAASGLKHAHEHGIVHRDIKPSNLILSKNGVVKLLDLGLARRKFDTAATAGLTNPGAIMGTADYMAPEQWDSARTVDIRADLYSLGCTLYYMLSGSPPYDDASNSSFQHKMHAHTVSPIPDIRVRRPDCSPELCQVLQRLLAKDANQRFAAPGEVEEALAPFASAKGLKELVAGTLDYPTVRIEQPSGGSKTPPAAQVGSSPPVKVDTDAATHETLSQPGSSKSQSAVKVRPAGSVVRSLAVGGVFAVLLLAVIAVLALLFMSPAPRDAHVIKERLATMPGLNGGWWFHETPWLVPSVRLELMAAVDRGETMIAGVDLRQLTHDMHQGSDIPAVYEKLKHASEHLVKERFKGAERTLLLDLFSNDPEQLSDEKYDQLLSESLKRLASLTDPTPEQLHLRGVLYQNQAQWDLAESSFVAAQSAYESRPKGSKELSVLLLSDYGRLLSDRGSMQSSSVLSQAEFDAREFQTPAFLVSLLLVHVESKQRDGVLTDALKLADRAVAISEESLSPTHPLVAAAHEKLGWVRLDQYRFTLAKTQFARAASLREKDLADSDNHRALKYVLHDRQGEYMCDYFLGNHKAAIVELKKLITEKFNKPLEGNELTLKERRELQERLPNTWERLGDCYLLGERDFTEAAKTFEIALEKAEEAHWGDGRLTPDLIRLRYKLAIALALEGKDSRADAEKVFSTAEPAEEAAALNDKQKRRFTLAREVARSRLALDENTPEKRLAGFQALGKILADPTPLLREPDSLNRDDLSLLLLAAHVFFESDTIGTEMPAARQEILGEVASSLAKRCHDPIRASNGELKVFIKPYLDSMRTALEESLKETDSPALKEVLERLKNE